MSEGGLRSEAIRPGAPVTVGAVVLVPIERIVLRGERRGSGMWLSALKEPYALIVRDGDGMHAVDQDAIGVPLDALREKVPGLDALLASLGC